jgi:hypothetical protein
VSTGRLILSNKRAAFVGDAKSFNAPWDKVLNIELYRDGVRFSLTNRSKPAPVKTANIANIEIIAAVISHAVSTHGEKDGAHSEG